MIDPLALSRFLQLDGASELIDSFAAIPEGPMREAIVHLARTTAATYAASAVIAPEPAGKSAPLALPTRRPLTDDDRLKAVDLMLGGASPAQAATTLGLDIKTVLAARKTAKRHGAVFPKIRMTNKVVELRPQKAKSMAGKPATARFPVTMEELTPRGVLGLAATARVLQLTPELLMLKRAEAVKLFNQGVTGSAAGAQLGIPRKMIENWKTIARHAGLVPPAHQAEAV
jgi:hypothetical protein